jgi:hypothetical protein
MTWTWSHDIPLDGDKVGNVSAGPRRRMLIVVDAGPGNGAQAAIEYEGDGTLWTAVPNGSYHALSELGFGIYGPIFISPDGLRITYQGGSGFVFSDRPDLKTRFRRAEPLDDIGGERPQGEHAFVAEDCSSVYFSGLGAVLRAHQK